MTEKKKPSVGGGRRKGSSGNHGERAELIERHGACFQEKIVAREGGKG